MMETFNKTTSMVLENINGPMVECLRVTGSTIVWKERESFPGAMVENTLESTKTTKNTVREPSHGQMADATKENGIKESSMVRAFISKKERRDMEFGKWAKESNGSKMIINKPSSKIEIINIDNLEIGRNS